MQPFPDLKSLNRWIPLALALIVSLLAASVAWMLASSYRVAVAALFFLLAFFGVSLFLTLLVSLFNSLTQSIQKQTGTLINRIYQSEQELRSMVAIRPLLDDSLVSFNGWAVEAGIAERLLYLIKELHLNSNSTGLVLECGSGASTIAIAHFLKKSGRGRIISLEHKAEFAEAMRRTLKEAGLVEVATVLDTSLRSWPVNGHVWQWYDFDPASYLQHKIDLLVVDGPPGRSGPMARYPAVPLLKDFLHPESVILLHDAHREDEKKTAEMWEEELGVTPELLPNGKGAWLFRLTGSPVRKVDTSSITPEPL